MALSFHRTPLALLLLAGALLSPVALAQDDAPSGDEDIDDYYGDESSGNGTGDDEAEAGAETPGFGVALAVAAAGAALLAFRGRRR